MLKVARAVMRYFARSKFSMSLVHKKNFYLNMTSFILSHNIYFVKRGRIPLLNLNELGEMSQVKIILGNFVNKNSY